MKQYKVITIVTAVVVIIAVFNLIVYLLYMMPTDLLAEVIVGILLILVVSRLGSKEPDTKPRNEYKPKH